MSDLHDVQFGITSMTVKRGYPMRAPTERDQCQAKLDILVEGFMGDDWDAYREAFAWLRDFANLKNTERGRVTCGSRRFTPQAIELVRERAQLRKGQQRRRAALIEHRTATKFQNASAFATAPAASRVRRTSSLVSSLAGDRRPHNRNS